MAGAQNETLLTLTADIVAAHVSNNNVAVSDLATTIERVHGALAGLGSEPAEAAPALKPAVSVRASVKPEHIVCLEDGTRFKMLKKHLPSSDDRRVGKVCFSTCRSTCLASYLIKITLHTYITSL